MIAALVVLVLVAGPLGLLALGAALRAGQCASLLEDNPDLAVPAPPEQLRRAA
jgi:hypothetical protein